MPGAASLYPFPPLWAVTDATAISYAVHRAPIAESESGERETRDASRSAGARAHGLPSRHESDLSCLAPTSVTPWGRRIASHFPEPLSIMITSKYTSSPGWHGESGTMGVAEWD